MTGVDLSPAMLDRARKRSADAGAEVTYVRADAREYEAPGGFDVVLDMFTSFGYFEDPADNARVLRTMYTCLAPGGKLVLDLTGKELLARRVTPPKVVRRGDDLMVQTDTVLDEWARLRSEWVLVAGPGRASDAGHLDVVRVQRGGAAADGRGDGFRPRGGLRRVRRAPLRRECRAARPSGGLRSVREAKGVRPGPHALCRRLGGP
ncbi:class I SAM-dependent methyltransferase [Streptomyces sp. NPDC014764]|uniref:class I SAM-dependent methyltransferase n=1 Tax=Streptomyces sp. NPDC014764 TaxID=3364907 RepID=UPI0036FFCFAD